MKNYRGYTIKRITRLDWIIKDANNQTVPAADGRPSCKTLKEAKATVDAIIEAGER